MNRPLPASVDVAVIGAGAAGLAVTIFLARRRPDLSIIALDSARKIGAKILISGGGRCNVTNVRVTPDDFYGGNRNVIRRALRAFSEADARALFEEMGVALHEEEHGKLFPDSNSARSILDALLGEAERCGAGIIGESRVIGIERLDHRFAIAIEQRSGDGPRAAKCSARRVVLATGGRSLPKTGSDGFGYTLAERLGHSVTPTFPALDPLLLDGDFHTSLSGIAQEVELTIRVEGDRPVRIRGDMLWTHFGVSGPVALDASRFFNHAKETSRSVTVDANLLPGRDFGQAENEWMQQAGRQPKAKPATLLKNVLPARVADAVLDRLGMTAGPVAGQLPRDDRRRLINALLAWRLPVVGTRGYKYAEVTAGGVPLAEVEPATMASRKCPGLYLIGEILDVDGRIGGFNFQWAWSSAWLAAEGLAREFSKTM